MVAAIRKRIWLLLLLAVVCIAAALAALWLFSRAQTFALGGVIHAYRHPPDEVRSAAALTEDMVSERFQRPSKQRPLPNPYTFALFEGKTIPPFNQPQEVIKAYFGILKDASNMEGFSGGCGTIGYAEQPYPYAYQLLTPEAQRVMPPEAFTESFSGYGHITFLQMHPSYTPPGSPPGVTYYMVELESITGRRETGGRYGSEPSGSLFNYHYGVVTVRKVPQEGWKIDRLDFAPEDFLCAPYHGWSYDAVSVVNIVFDSNLDLVDRIDAVTEKDNLITVTASGHGNRYRFVFVRLTNGTDVLLHQYLWKDGRWLEGNFLTPDWSNFLLTPESLASGD